MRLTLRTLLAYMDDILDPADQEELGRKIEASAFATELIHRSRDAVRRLRLGAPDPLAGDSGEVLEGEGDSHLDANTAAEYLDNTLSPEAVAEFERSCLEAGLHADMLLAEAASCHHILTLVLGEPAEVDADLRERMYRLADESSGQQLRVEPAHVSPGREAVAAMAPAVAPAPVADRRPQVDYDAPTTPDYLREAARTRRQRQHAIMAFVGAVVIGAVAAFVFWPEGETKLPDQVAEMGDVDDLTSGVEVGENGAESAATVDATADAESAADEEDADSEAPAFDAAAATPSDQGAVPETEEQPETSADEAGAGPAAAAAAEAAAAPEVGVIAPGAANVETPVEPVPPEAMPPADPGAESSAAPPTPPQVPPQDPQSGAPPTPPQGLPGDAAPPDATANVTPQPTPQIPTPPAAAPGAAVVPPQPGAAPTAPAGAPDAGVEPAAASIPAPVSPQPKTIGAYFGNNDVLLRHDSSSDAWLRLPPRSSLTPGDRLLAPPTFRTHVQLADANAYLGGGAEIQLEAPGAESDPASTIRLALPYGRIILNSGLNGNRIELTAGDEVRALTLGPSSSLAVEVVRTLQPGSNPAREPAAIHISWYLTSGTAQTDEALAGADITAPAAWVTAEGQDQLPQAIEELPPWIDSEPITDLERRARDAVAESLQPAEPVNLRLAELSDESSLGRRTEVRALAAKAGAYVGEFDPLVKALSDVTQRAAWKSQIDALRGALARDPANVEKIHKSLAEQRGQKAADDLMEMLVGFSREDVGTTREDVKNGALVRLIRWLENDELIYRVLASQCINEITGTTNLGGYRPEHTAAQRTREIKYYWDRLERGELMPK